MQRVMWLKSAGNHNSHFLVIIVQTTNLKLHGHVRQCQLDLTCLYWCPLVAKEVDLCAH